MNEFLVTSHCSLISLKIAQTQNKLRHCPTLPSYSFVNFSMICRILSISFQFLSSRKNARKSAFDAPKAFLIMKTKTQKMTKTRRPRAQRCKRRRTKDWRRKRKCSKNRSSICKFAHIFKFIFTVVLLHFRNPAPPPPEVIAAEDTMNLTPGRAKRAQAIATFFNKRLVFRFFSVTQFFIKYFSARLEKRRAFIRKEEQEFVLQVYRRLHECST